MLVSFAVHFKKSNRETVVIPASSGATVLSLYQGIVDHSFDSTEPPSETGQRCTTSSGRKSSRQQNFQDVPLIAQLSEVVVVFGMYFQIHLDVLIR